MLRPVVQNICPSSGSYVCGALRGQCTCTNPDRPRCDGGICKVRTARAMCCCSCELLAGCLSGSCFMGWLGVQAQAMCSCHHSLALCARPSSVSPPPYPRRYPCALQPLGSPAAAASAPATAKARQSATRQMVHARWGMCLRFLHFSPAAVQLCATGHYTLLHQFYHYCTPRNTMELVFCGLFAGKVCHRHELWGRSQLCV